MKSFLLVSVVLCLSVASLGSPLKGSPTALKDVQRYKEEIRFRANHNEPLVFGFERNDGTLQIVDLASEVGSLESIPPLDYPKYIDFHLFQKKNGKIKVTKLPVDPSKILDLGFQKSLETKVVFHGYLNNLNSEVVQLISRGFAANFDYNVIAVDWGRISNDLPYANARYHVEGVGQYVGQFLSTLFKASLVEPSKIHMIGHSLGAHVAGYAGKAAKKEGWTVGRITGLDPAGPLFQNPVDRLTKDDAALVDVIHTCARYLGLAGNLGHIDFYPNEGKVDQPGCDLDFTGSCSHARSYEFFIESITRPDAFIGKFCPTENDWSNCDKDTTAVMGAAPISFKKEGAYYLKTKGSSPFGLGGNGLE